MPEQDPEPTDPERLLLHLIDVGAARDGYLCPVCGKHDWDILGVVAAVDLKRSGPISGRPMVQVVCSTCFYLQHFLWDPIRQKKFPSEALEALRQRVRAIEVEEMPATFEAPTTVEGRHGE